MRVLKTYFEKIIKYDLINTFIYKNLKNIPKFKKLILNFGYKKSNLKYLISGLLALEFISSKKGKLTKSKHLNLLLKLKKGNPVGCKIVLKKSSMYFFYLKLITFILPKIKQFQISQQKRDLKNFKFVSFQLKTPLLFAELENQFQLFKEIPRLDVTLLTNSKSQKELFFLLKSVKLV
jgi:large subunit ribosomal protein L5